MAPLPLPTTAVLHAVIARDVSSSCNANGVPCVEVVCAWPLSGQYGFGQRILYYVLVVTCVVARKVKWMKAVCLAGALLVPAVAAVHGIILASLHTDGATDMDIYGALQICSIGILAAPITVKSSSTFFNAPGRNMIFLWTGLNLAGLLSLAVEFYRTNPTPCPGTIIGTFPYGTATCGLVCTPDEGPVSPLRTGAASEKFVVPKPDIFRFGIAMFLAAAECVPAILSLVTMGNRILEVNLKKPQGGGSPQNEQGDLAVNPNVNDSTSESMKAVNQAIRNMLKAVEIPVLAGFWLTVLIIGEINFWSPSLQYHTEPIGSIGQWGTILGTGMAGLGSLYVYLAEKFNEDGLAQTPTSRCFCSHLDSPPTIAVYNEFPDERDGVITRRKMARWAGKVGNYFGNPSQDPFAAGNFQASVLLQVPGEDGRTRNPADQDSIMESRASHDDQSSGDDGSVALTTLRSPSPRTRRCTLPSQQPSTAASSSNDQMARTQSLQVPPPVRHRG